MIPGTLSVQSYAISGVFFSIVTNSVNAGIYYSGAGNLKLTNKYY